MTKGHLLYLLCSVAGFTGGLLLIIIGVKAVRHLRHMIWLRGAAHRAKQARLHYELLALYPDERGRNASSKRGY